MNQLRTGTVVDSPVRGYGRVTGINVTVPHIGTGLVAVKHDGETHVLYYQPGELTPVK